MCGPFFYNRVPPRILVLGFWFFGCGVLVFEKYCFEADFFIGRRFIDFAPFLTFSVSWHNYNKEGSLCQQVF